MANNSNVSGVFEEQIFGDSKRMYGSTAMSSATTTAIATNMTGINRVSCCLGSGEGVSAMIPSIRISGTSVVLRSQASISIQYINWEIEGY